MSLIATTYGHFYKRPDDSTFYPSVTTILHHAMVEHPSLTAWKGRPFQHPFLKNHAEYIEYTSIRGTLIHYNVLNTVLPGTKMDASSLPPLMAWEQWHSPMLKDIDHARNLWIKARAKLNIRPPLMVEREFFHQSKRYAGTPDLSAMINGQQAVLDIKTSKQPYDKHFIQIGAYADLINKNISGMTRVEIGYLVYLNPDSAEPDIIPIDHEELAGYTAEFNELLREFYGNAELLKKLGIQQECGACSPPRISMVSRQDSM